MSFSSRAFLLNRRTSLLQRGHRLKHWRPSLPSATTAASRLWQLPLGLRHEMTLTGDDKTGHIEAGNNESLLFFNNIFPQRLRWLAQSEYVMSRLRSDTGEHNALIGDTVKRALPPSLPIKVNAVIPRFREGGVFVRFSHDEHILPTEIEGMVKEHLRTNEVKLWWNPFVRVHTGLVRGRPWVEDLKRVPCSRLKVEFVPAESGVDATELSQEQLYSIFRPYGTLGEIVPQSQDSKILPKFAYIDYVRTKRAIMAKNCLHGFRIVGEDGNKALAKLKISYEHKAKTNWIWDWLMNHPRITIPLFAALVATTTVAVFDPIRTFSVKAHITRQFDVTTNRLYKWFVSRASDLLTFRRRKREDAGLNAIWDDHKDQIEQIRKWLLETSDTFIVIQGARGSGKRELVVDQALKDRKNTLVLDCKPVQEARGDANTIDAMASEVGYRPVFSWMNSISGLIDLAAQGATGMKTGFSETLDSQLQKILNNTATALKQISLEPRKNDDLDAHLPDDAYLEAHPETRPVIVIDNYLHKSQEGSIVYDKLAEWAARVTGANIAHVIFLTTDVSFSKSLSKALPDRVFRQISLEDCSPEAAKRYVVSHLHIDPDTSSSGVAPDNDDDDGDAAADDETSNSPVTPIKATQDLSELDACLAYLGGRLTDLEFLARRIKAGEPPSRAVQEIINQSASEIIKMYLLNSGIASDGESRKWRPEQAWQLVQQLAQSPNGAPLRYNAVVQSDAFKAAGASSSSTSDPDAALAALQQAELIAIVSSKGRPHAIKPGKPVFQAAFELLAKDAVLAARMDVTTLGALIAAENAAVDKAERELELLASLGSGGGPPGQLRARAAWLLRKCQASQAKIERWEGDVARAKAVLNSEF